MEGRSTFNGVKSTGAIRWEVDGQRLDADEINETDRRIRSAIEEAAIGAGATSVIGLYNQQPGVRPALWGDDRPKEN